MNLKDIAEPYGKEWLNLLWRIVDAPRWGARKTVDHPSDKELADAIRARPTIPPELVEYVAGRLDGTKPRPRGRPDGDPTHRWMRSSLLRSEVRLREAAFKLQGVKAPRKRAIEVQARKLHMGPDSLRTLLKVRSPTRSLHSWDFTLAEAREMLDEDLEKGVVALDTKEGFVQLETPSEIPL